MCSTNEEKTLNDAYLIVKGEGKEMKKISSRTNLPKYSTLTQTQKD